MSHNRLRGNLIGLMWSKGLLFDLVDKKTACQILGVSKTRVDQLAEHALLGRALVPNKKGFGRWGLSRIYLETMPYFGGDVETLNEEDHPDKISLAFILKYLFQRDHLFPRLMIAVIEQRIMPRGVASGHRGISAWLFDRMEFSKWMEA